MRRWLLGGIAATLLSISLLGADVVVGLEVGTVRMDYLNTVVQAMAERQGAPYTPLRVGWDVRAELFPLPGVGVRGYGLGVFGGISGREEWGQSATAVGVEAVGRVSLRSLGIPLGMGVDVGIGGCWGMASGLVTGGGFGWGGTVSVSWTVYQAGLVNLDLGLSLRYLVVGTIRDGERTIDTGGMSAMDFSGAGLSVHIRWGR